MTVDAKQATDNISHNHKVALDLAARGIAVFPCQPVDGPPDHTGHPQWRAKRPMPRIKWKEAATTDVEIINAWWGVSPDALIGMPLGPLDIIALDADRHPGGPDGIKAFNALCKAYPGLGEGQYVQTPNGEHYLFKQIIPKHGNSEGALPKGINVRGEGGYVIAPGCVLPDGRGWVLMRTEKPIRSLPRPIIDMLQGVAQPNESTFESHDPLDDITYPADPRQAAYMHESVKNAFDKVVTAAVGHRNETLNTQALKLGHFIPRFLDEREITDLLTEAAIIAGLDTAEIGPSIRSGMSTGMKQPIDPFDVANEYWDGDIDPPDAAASGEDIQDGTEAWDAPTPDYLIDGMIPKGGVGLLIGDTQTFKSFIAQSIALAISQGHQDWEGHAIKAPQDAAVLYIAGEGGTSSAALRMRAWAEHNGLTRDTFKPGFKLITFPINLTDKTSTLQLVKKIAAITTPIALIILDTLNTSAPGAEENSTKEMGVLYAVCRNIGKRFSAAVLGVHHTNKRGGSRGANLLQQNADFLLFLERKDFLTMNTTMTVTKLKDGPSGHKEHYHLDLVALPDGTTSLAPHKIGAIRAEATETTASGRPSSKADAILSVLKASQDIRGETASAICAILDIDDASGKRNTQQTLRRLKSRGLVTRKGERWLIVENDFLD